MGYMEFNEQVFQQELEDRYIASRSVNIIYSREKA